jgi:hypothetical protein
MDRVGLFELTTSDAAAVAAAVAAELLTSPLFFLNISILFLR